MAPKSSSSKHRNQSIQLKDNRTLGYAEYGDPEGSAVFHFHGGNSSRLEAAWFEEAAARKGVRLIAPDRPGVGLSDPEPNRSLLDWAEDVKQLADALNIDAFAVMGLSGGGPHAAAAAYGLPERVSAAAIVSGTAPPEMPNKLRGMFFPLRFNFIFAKYAPILSKFFLKQMSGTYADREKFLSMIKMGLPEPDKQLAEKTPEKIFQFTDSAAESHKQGIEADFLEWQLYVQPWGFPLAEIRSPVFLWYGEVDMMVPLAMGKYLHEQIPGSVLRVVPDGGHFSTINNHIDQIFDDLVQNLI